ncbi:MAG: sensor histidine kinase, partial [Candidatus Ornithospirochaeta sp.]
LLAAVRISPSTKKTTLEAKRNLLLPIFENIAMALDRIEITEERAKVRETMERERERANLLRAISHDLRTPLSGIMGTSEMLMDMTEKDDKRQVLLKGIYQDADWLKNLVENILSLTRLQDGKIVPHKEMEAMEEVIGSAVAHMEKNIGNKRIIVETPMDFKLVPMDAKLVEQVVYNLLDNAIKHTSENEEVKVILSYTPNSAVVSVLDQGEGLSEEDIPHIFDIFYTSRSRSADVKKGIGLGLTICRTVIGAHGGTIKAENRKDGKGAVFTFSLPLEEKIHG